MKKCFSFLLLFLFILEFSPSTCAQSGNSWMVPGVVQGGEDTHNQVARAPANVSDEASPPSDANTRKREQWKERRQARQQRRQERREQRKDRRQARREKRGERREARRERRQERRKARQERRRQRRESRRN